MDLLEDPQETDILLQTQVAVVTVIAILVHLVLPLEILDNASGTTPNQTMGTINLTMVSQTKSEFQFLARTIISFGVELLEEEQTAMITVAKQQTVVMDPKVANKVKDSASQRPKLNSLSKRKIKTTMTLKSLMESTFQFQWDQTMFRQVTHITAVILDQNILRLIMELATGILTHHLLTINGSQWVETHVILTLIVQVERYVVLVSTLDTPIF